MGRTLNVLPVVTLWHAQLQNHCLSHDLIEFEIWNQPLGNLYITSGHMTGCLVAYSF